MINPEDYLEIGFLKKLSGTDGSFVLELNHQQKNCFLDKEEPIFLSIHGNLVPFFMDEIIPDKNFPIIHFDTVLSRESAIKYLKIKCFIHHKFLETDTNSIQLEALIGYTFSNQNGRVNLLITGVNDITENPLIQVQYENQMVLIPLIYDYISEINSKERILVCQYPKDLLDGLLSL
jgi:16S rRNA processing protein RimM